MTSAPLGFSLIENSTHKKPDSEQLLSPPKLTSKTLHNRTQKKPLEKRITPQMVQSINKDMTSSDGNTDTGVDENGEDDYRKLKNEYIAEQPTSSSDESNQPYSFNYNHSHRSPDSQFNKYIASVSSQIPNNLSSDSSFFPDSHNSTQKELLTKLNYMIHMLEEQQEQKTGSVIEELILYCFLGVFIIFTIDSFAKVGRYTR